MKDKKKVSSKEKADKGMVAKKDFVINHNEVFIEIKIGDDLSEVPELYWENLKTEGVL